MDTAGIGAIAGFAANQDRVVPGRLPRVDRLDLIERVYPRGRAGVLGLEIAEVALQLTLGALQAMHPPPHLSNSVSVQT